METIVFLIILWVISTVGKKVFEVISQEGKGGGKEKESLPGWQQKLMEVAKTIKEEIETQNALAQGEGNRSKTSAPPPLKKTTKKKRLPERKETGGKKFATSTRETDSRVQKISARQSSNVTSEFCEEKDSKQYGTEKEQKACSGKRSKRTIHQRELKKAIMWKEILDKPVGLRDKGLGKK